MKLIREIYLGIFIVFDEIVRNKKFFNQFNARIARGKKFNN